MKTIILGQLSDINKYRVDDIVNKYHPSYVVRKKDDVKFSNINNYQRPIVGNLLIYVELVEEKPNLPKFLKLLDRLYEINCPYIDILIHIPNSLLKSKDVFNIVSSVDIIDLSTTYKEDFKNYIELKFNIEKRYISMVTKSLRYSVKAIEQNYQYLLDKKYSEIKATKNIEIENIVYELLQKSSKGLKLFEELSSRYSYNWVIIEIISILEQCLTYKIKLYKQNKIKIRDIPFEYKNIVVKVPIYLLYKLLLNLRLYNKMGILIFYKEEIENE